MRIIKNTSHQTATFVILEPEVEDRNGDIISPDEIVNTAHRFMRNLHDKRVNMDHQPHTDLDDVAFVESFIAPTDLDLGGEVIRAGSWLVAFKFYSAERWQALLDGEISGVSMEGYGYSNE